MSRLAVIVIFVKSTPMKKLLLLFILSANSVFAQTNVYHPFPDSNAIWNIHWNCFFGTGEAWFSYYIDGDTTIGNLVYQKMMRGPVVSTGTCGTGGYPYLGAFREDTVAKKVYHIHPFESMEMLHLDFNLQVGDTFPDAMQFPCSSTVQAIDSVLIGTNYRKRWTLASSAQIIEGIGSTWGLMEPPCDVIDFPATTLTCFSQNGQTLYPDTTFNCLFIDDVESIDGIKNSLVIFPNPAREKFAVCSFQFPVNSHLKIFNTLGEIIYSTPLKDPIEINCGHFPRGIYFVEVQSETEIRKGKIILR